MNIDTEMPFWLDQDEIAIFEIDQNDGHNTKTFIEESIYGIDSILVTSDVELTD